VRLIRYYLAREILRPALSVLVFLLAVVLVFYASQLLARAAAESLPVETVLIMALLRLGLYLDVLIPASVLLGMVIGLGRLQAGYEIIAMAAGGTGRRQILSSLVPWLLALAVIVAGLTTIFRPWAYSTLYALERELAAELDLTRIETGRFQVGDDQWLIYAEGASNGGLDRVLVHQRQPGFDGVLRARRLDQAAVGEDRMKLIFQGDVRSYRIEPGGRDDLIGEFDRLEVEFETRPPPEREQLRRAIPTLELIGEQTPIERAELQWRFLGPVSVLALALLAISISRINPRQGQSARVLSASLAGTLYFSLLGVLMNWLEQATLPAWPGLFLLPLMLMLGLALRALLFQRGPGYVL
jgi:lipopolysaccharide export system permease protein